MAKIPTTFRLAGWALVVASWAPWAAAAPADSGMNATLLYNSLHAEMMAAQGQLGQAAALMLNLANLEGNRPELFQRATELALQSGQLPLALKASDAWHKQSPDSAEAARYALQLNISANHTEAAIAALHDFLKHSPTAERNTALLVLPAYFMAENNAPGQIALEPATAKSLEQVLTPYSRMAEHAAASYSAITSLRLQSGQASAALDAALLALQHEARNIHSGWALLDLLQQRAPNSQTLSAEQQRRALEALEQLILSHEDISPGLRLRYSAYLIEQQRPEAALVQVQKLVQQRPDSARFWLMQGLVQADIKQTDAARTSIQTSLRLLEQQAGDGDDDNPSRIRDEGLLALSLMAQEEQDYALAERYLSQVSQPDSPKIISRRAALLSEQGRWQEAVALVQGLPLSRELDSRKKLMAEVQLLSAAKQYAAAQQRLAAFVAANPQDSNAIYSLAILADRQGNFVEFERLMRQVIALEPDDAHAHNALGYTLADRNERLPEALALIEQALQLQPGDPIMLDSLGWVLFRMGQLNAAYTHLSHAYAQLPDPEIAAHLGEVLWQQGRRADAERVWQQGLEQDGEHEVLQQTIQRLRGSAL